MTNRMIIRKSDEEGFSLVTFEGSPGWVDCARKRVEAYKLLFDDDV